MSFFDKKEIKTKYRNIHDLLKRIDEVKGHSFAEFDINNRLSNPKNKGALGQIVEEGIFGYSINNSAAADFEHLGIELKTTGVIVNKNNTVSAKERLTLSTINYSKIVEQDFIHSDVWIKNKGLLLVLYQYIPGGDYQYMPIIKGLLHRFSPEDLLIIKKDYELIASKVKEGKADEISEGDTMYLGACTAGADSNDLVSQPFSDKKARLRKFSLKTSYMTQIIRESVAPNELEHLFSLIELENNSFETALEFSLKKYYGYTESEIAKLFSIDTKSKSRFERYVAKMLKIEGSVNNTKEFKKANIELKTIRIEENSNIEQSMSFPAFSFKDIVNEDWEESDFRDVLLNKKFLFAVFQKKDGEYRFTKVIFWNIPMNIVEKDGKEVYQKLQDVLASGNIVSGFKSSSDGKTIRTNNFPKKTDNPHFHVRPHGRDSNDVFPLPVPDKLTGLTEYTKQCFWINKEYILSVIENEINK